MSEETEVSLESLQWTNAEFLHAVIHRLTEEEWAKVQRFAGPRLPMAYVGIWMDFCEAVRPGITEQVAVDRLIELAPDLWERIDTARTRSQGMEL